MTTKDKILSIFETNKGKWLSGEALAENTGVTRAAVWKAVKALENAGYPIEAVTGYGYRLLPGTDILSKQGIEKYLSRDSGIGLSVVPVTGSTNADVKKAAQDGAKEGYTVIAAQQTKGSGRRGRSFYSPADSGVYISVLLRPENCTPEIAMRITTIAAVAACRAIEKVQTFEEKTCCPENPSFSSISAEKKPGIKWVNDVYVRGRKVCGILTQASFDLESNLLDYAVMGIGFNIYEPEGGFPPEIASVAGPVFTEKQDDARNKLSAAFLNCFMEEYRGLHDRGYAEEYRKRSIVIGKELRVLNGTEYNAGPDAGKKAKALAIDDDCRLLVEYADGTREWLSSGEISIRL